MTQKLPTIFLGYSSSNDIALIQLAIPISGKCTVIFKIPGKNKNVILFY
jgi:hypothetical protein